MSEKASSGQRRVSLRDLAREIGVSHVTISLALRGDPRISKKRREEVETAAKKFGYRPDPMLASLSAYRQSKRPATIRSAIAWINQWDNPKELATRREFSAYWSGAKETAEALGYRLEECVVGSTFGPRLEKILFTRNVRGILIPPHLRDLVLPGFDWGLFSVVRLGVSVEHPRAHVITSDQINCAALAFEQIRRRGYSRVGYVTTEVFDRNTGGNFRAGYLKSQDAGVLASHQIAPLILREDSTTSDVQRLQRWLSRAKPDAVITTVSQFPSLLVKLGWKVPKDLGVAALSVLDGNFDSGVDQNSYEIGQVAMRTLAGLIQQNERGIPRYCRRILVEGRWVDGTSLPQKALRRKNVANGYRR